MKLNTLSNIIDDILLIARNNSISESEHLSRYQIEMWVHQYRALLIKQDIDKGRDINPMYVQTIRCIHLERKECIPGHFVYVSDITLPKLIDFHFRTGLISVKDMYGNLIQLGSESKMKLQKYRKYTCKDYIAYLKDSRIYVEGGNNQLEYIEADVILENPADANECFDPDEPYPAPAHMIPTIKDLIFSKELNVMPKMPTDTTNNSNDDMQNIYKQQQ